MRITFVSTQRTWGGGENLLAQLVTGCRRAGAEVALAAPAGSEIGTWADQEASVPWLPMPGRGRTPTAMWRLRRWFSDGKYDIALLNDPHAITYGGLALSGSGVPRVGVRHTVFPVRSAWKHHRLLDRVVAVSRASREGCLTAGISPEHVEVIHGGVDPLPADPTAIATARTAVRPTGQLAGEPILLAVGSLLPVKGFETLIEAVALSAERGRGWRLVIAGEGPERARLEALVAERGVADRVRLLGFRDDVGALLQAADVLVSASHNEGLSLVVIEAMLAGCPVAATPVGGAREVLDVDGSGTSPVAWTFAPGNAEQAIQAIHAAIENTADKQHRVRGATAWAGEHFTVERMARDYLALFERLLPQRSTVGRAA